MLERMRIAADPALWTQPTDPRLDALRGSGIVTVINCAAVGENGPVIATFVYGPDGELLTRYHKQHLYAHEQSVFTPGDEDGCFEFAGLRFSLATCYDNHFPDLTARAADCDIHLASSLYGTGGGIHERATIYPRIAHNSNMYVALENHVGPAGPWTGCGGAAIWAPGGVLLQECDTIAPGIVTATVG